MRKGEIIISYIQITAPYCNNNNSRQDFYLLHDNNEKQTKLIFLRYNNRIYTLQLKIICNIKYEALNSNNIIYEITEI
jgi:hypothetical protein